MSLSKCPICGGRALTECFTLQDLPVFVNVTAESREEALRAPVGQLSIVQCTHCGFVFNADFQPEQVAYAQGYHAERGDSAVYRSHTEHVAELVREAIAECRGTILEIGCGTGEFLRTLHRKGGRNLNFLGVDPSVQIHQEGGIKFDAQLFDEAYLSRVPPDLVLLISRHMIEHVVNPLEMLRLFVRALPENGVLYLETPRLDWILEQGAFFDFGYEHCAYFTDSFMKRLLAAAGLQVIAMEKSYQGQYFSLCARRCAQGAAKGKEELGPVSREELLQAQQGFSRVRQAYLYEKNHIALTRDDCLWGCAQKGVVWLNLFDRQSRICVVDANPYKQGNFVLGTGHRILAPEELRYRPPKRIFVMNGIYMEEIKAMVKQVLPDEPMGFYAVERTRAFA